MADAVLGAGDEEGEAVRGAADVVHADFLCGAHPVGGRGAPEGDGLHAAGLGDGGVGGGGDGVEFVVY